MSDALAILRPAHPEDTAEARAFALRYEGRQRVHHADKLMAQFTAERLVVAWRRLASW